MKIIILITVLLFVSCGSKKNSMKCDAYNGSNSKMKYKKWYKRF